MSDSADTERTLWLSTDGDNSYLIPDDVELPEGDLGLRTLFGVERSVDADTAAEFRATSDEVTEHFQDQAQRRLAPVKDALSGILAEVGAAWRNAMDGLGDLDDSDDSDDGDRDVDLADRDDGADDDDSAPPDNVVPLRPAMSTRDRARDFVDSIAALLGQNIAGEAEVMEFSSERAGPGSAVPVALDEYGTLRRVALRHARDAFGSQERIDATWRELGYRAAPDFERAVAEYDGFVAALRDAGAEVEFLPISDDVADASDATRAGGTERSSDSASGALTLDSIYVRDASVMTPAGLARARMGKDARAGEPEWADAVYRELGLASGSGISAGCLEGGDVVWFDSTTCAVGEGYRSDPQGIARFRALLPRAVELIVCPLPHHRGPGDVFHLMSILSPLDDDLALVYSPLMPVRFRRVLLDRGIELVEIPDREFDAMGCNVLALGPRRCLMLDGLPETRRVLERAGCEVLVYSGEEISAKGQGGPTCLTRPLQRG